MKARFNVRALLWVSATCLPWAVGAQPSDSSGEQQEADYRVIAARCGTPGFEKAFYKQSKAAVAAGLVVKHRDPAQVEKTVTALRRNPVVLIGTQADCPDQVARLKELQKERAKALGTSRKSGKG
ncbi:hypothetical protein QTI24_17990 [Variovorax sp. J22P240]|uniref:hypothetical protein n=1 Tax=Variovorax sp. J22P240 TaxID=3053514 RepID=UPI002576E4C5|nr:hypothetical protein [Variovorax sp. J22P240]MDM0000516.1 hypothetical protein [Variovorax sp. J22P240]